MPRNVRNFWVETQVDGATRVEGGPKSKDGGFETVIRMRSNGTITTPLRLRGYVDRDGLLVLEVAANGAETAITTHR